jgi:hypothetical protein
MDTIMLGFLVVGKIVSQNVFGGGSIECVEDRCPDFLRHDRVMGEGRKENVRVIGKHSPGLVLFPPSNRSGLL